MKQQLLIILLLIAHSSYAQRNVILFIGDGFGIAPKTAARMAMGQGKEGKRYDTEPEFQVLALDKLRYTAMATTHSLNSWTTDSAPGATVYATGKKIDNEIISFDPISNLPIQTILEQAKKMGYAVGLVTTTRITHATPAAFGSHIWHRDLEDYIAAQLISGTQREYEEVFNSTPIDSLRYREDRDWLLPYPKLGIEIDVLMGGGAAHFFPQGYKDTLSTAAGIRIEAWGKRKDRINLITLAKKRGYTYVNTARALSSLDLAQFTPGSNKKLIGLFKSSHNSYEQDRQLTNLWEPSLAEMTRYAIEILKRKGGKKGFFLMVEGGRIDHLGHANAGAISKSCRLETDSVAYPPDGGNQRLKNTAQGDIYGSDYLIKEVLSFDYAIAEGHKLLKEKSQTLLFSTSDHECGAMALIGLSENGTVRTYAAEPTQSRQYAATPYGIKRGDNATQGFFPEYTLYEFEGKKYPKPSSGNARHIVVTYASNPGVVGGCGGNHTPQDIWIGADDNVGGKYASQITGRGMLDNTHLYSIMQSFLFGTSQRP